MIKQKNYIKVRLITTAFAVPALGAKDWLTL